MKKRDDITETALCPSGKARLSRIIKLMLASSVLTSGMAGAVLNDRGPSDALLTWPLWYRDNNLLPLGLCKSQVPSLHPEAAGAEMCFPIEPNANGFANNVGDEIFYMNLNAFIENGGVSLRYVTALEAAYGGLSGAPPVVAGPADQIVFSRVRFVMSVNDESCAGPYRIIHPWGDEFFPDVQPGPRALFETRDVPLGLLLDFDGVVKDGDVGPFLHWDGGSNNGVGGDEVILPRTPENFLKYGVEEFIGDPNVPHTYTGSPKIESKRSLPEAPLVAVTDDPNAVQNPALGPAYTLDGLPNGPVAHQNYIKVIAPKGCDIGGTALEFGGEGINVKKETLGNLLGQVWTANIPTPTKVTQAVFSRTTDTNNPKPTTIDVWAQSAPGQELYVTGNGLKVGTKMIPFDNNSRNYQAHIELGFNEPSIPSNIEVVNTLSTPVFLATSKLTDIVQINKAEFNTTSKRLCVSANSSDKQQLKLTTDEVIALEGTLDNRNKPGCEPAQPGDLTASVDFSSYNRAPEKAVVTSTLNGKAEQLVYATDGAPDNALAELTASNDPAQEVEGDPNTPVSLDIGSNDDAFTQYPGQPQIVIVTQPEQDFEVAPGLFDKRSVGTITAGTPGDKTVSFKSAPGAVGDASFKYFVRVGDDVSNLVTANLKVTFKPGKPVGVADNFAVLRTNNVTDALFYRAKVLANDTAAVGTTIDATTIEFSQYPTKGVVTAENGKIKYQPCALASPNVCSAPLTSPAAGNDTFSYTVKGKGGDGSLSSPSDPIPVNVVVQSTAETFPTTGQRFRSAGGRWDLRFSTTWIGNGLTPLGSCYLTHLGATAGTNPSALPTSLFIGKILADATGSFQIAAVGNKVVTTTNTATFGPNDIPTIPANFRFRVRCGTSNAAPEMPNTGQAVNSANQTAS